MNMVKASSFIVILLILTLGLVQVSCQGKAPPSILVIAVDDLNVNDILCNQETMTDNSRSGFEILCRESVRFTHAFNPSVLSTPTLASLFTGLFPFDHKVHNNSAPPLHPKLITVAEVAVMKGYRTAFFSGGAPVWRRSGLNQGFEVFDDNVIPNRHVLYRSFATNSKAFMQWLRQDVEGSSAYFASIYVPDLLFTNTETVNEYGETRNLSHESQLDEFDDNLYQLFKELQRQNRWNDTTIVVVGLNGHTSNDRPGELTPTNLHGENTQVALFIKPTQKVRDEALQWKIDRNVSLVDVGETLFELLGERNPNSKGTASVPVYSLIEALRKSQPNWPESRVIAVESDWAQWRGMGNTRCALIGGHILYIYDPIPKIYNTLTDRLETNPLRGAEFSFQDQQKMQEILKSLNCEPWQGLSKETIAKYSPSFTRWMRQDQKSALLKELKSKIGKNPDQDILRWSAALALELNDWNSLKWLGSKAENNFWQFVAERNGAARNSAPVEFSFADHTCLKLLVVPRIDSQDFKKCENPLFLDFVDWMRSDARDLSRDTQKRKFERAYLYHLIDQNIARASIATTFIWDTPSKLALGPSLTDLVLSLPEYQKQKVSLERALQTSSVWDDE